MRLAINFFLISAIAQFGFPCFAWQNEKLIVENPYSLLGKGKAPLVAGFVTGKVPQIGSRISYDAALGDHLAAANSRLYNFYGGTGATNSSALLSMKEALNRYRADGYYGVVWDNPLSMDPSEFDFDTGPESWANEKGQLRVQQDFMIRSIGHSIASAPEGVLQNAVTRSTSTAVIFQLLHDYIVDAPHAAVIGQLDTVIASGVLGHLPEEVDLWVPKELEQLTREKRLDCFAHQQDRRLFSSLTFAPKLEGSRRFPTAKRLPKIYVFVGSSDPMVTELEQMEVLRRFSVLHPDLSITAFVIPAGHNPTFGERTTGWKTHHALQVFSKIAAEGTRAFPADRGLTVMFHPRYEKQKNNCKAAILAVQEDVRSRRP